MITNRKILSGTKRVRPGTITLIMKQKRSTLHVFICPFIEQVLIFTVISGVMISVLPPPPPPPPVW